ncbi:hypothetical protein SNE40_005212 [Patella caerulea]|uniref:Uncharacterized protein n=1 Tax=Patella caerulea TaxID=87958 RepID=A0AAN8K253_PATCE
MEGEDIEDSNEEIEDPDELSGFDESVPVLPDGSVWKSSDMALDEESLDEEIPILNHGDGVKDETEFTEAIPPTIPKIMSAELARRIAQAGERYRNEIP